MAQQDFDVDSLARYLHISPAQVSKLADRGSVPGRKIGGQWVFSQGEIHHWLEERIGAAGEADLQHVQGLLDRAATQHEAASVVISELLLPEAIAIPETSEPSNSRVTIHMRGNISNRKSGRQSNRQARIIKTTRTVLK